MLHGKSCEAQDGDEQYHAELLADEAYWNDRRRWEEDVANDDREALTVRLQGLLGDLDELLTWASTRPGVVPNWLSWILTVARDAIEQHGKETPNG